MFTIAHIFENFKSGKDNSMGKNIYNSQKYNIFNENNLCEKKILELNKFFASSNLDTHRFSKSTSFKSPKKENDIESSLNKNFQIYNNTNTSNENTNIVKVIIQQNHVLIKKQNCEYFSDLEVGMIIMQEKEKLIYLSKIYQSLLDLNKRPHNMYCIHTKSNLINPIKYEGEASSTKTSKKNKKVVYFRLDALKINDISLQIIICVILGLYLIQIISKKIAYVLLKFIFNKYKLYQNNLDSIHYIKNILEMRTEFLLGVYYSLIDNLKNLLVFYSRRKNSVELINKNNSFLIEGNTKLKLENEGELKKRNFSENANKLIYLKNCTNPNKASENCNKHDSTGINDLLGYFNENPHVKWNEIFTALKFDKLLFFLNLIEERNQCIFNDICEISDRKNYILKNIIKPIDHTYYLFDEVIILIQYLSDFIKLNNFHELLLVEYTKDYRYFLETKDLFFHYLNKKSKVNAIFSNWTDRIFIKHKQNYLGNHIFFKLKEKLIEEKKNANDNYLGILKSANKNDVSNEKILKENISKTISNIYDINNSNQKQGKFKKRTNITFENFNKKFLTKKEQSQDHIDKYDPNKNNQTKKQIVNMNTSISMSNKKLPKSEKNNRQEVEKINNPILKTFIHNKINSDIELYSSIEKKLKNISENNFTQSLYKSQYLKEDLCSFENRDNDRHVNNQNKHKRIFSLTSSNFYLTNMNNNVNSSSMKTCDNLINNQFPDRDSNFLDIEYKFVPKCKFNKTHKNFFRQELYKAKLTNDINFIEDTKKDDIQNDEISDFLKTIKIKVVNDRHTTYFDQLNEFQPKNNQNLIQNPENILKNKKIFCKTTNNFLSNKKRDNSNLLIIETNKNNNINSYDRYCKNSLHSNRKPSLFQENNSELAFSQNDSRENFRKTPNNFFYNSSIFNQEENSQNFNMIVSAENNRDKNTNMSPISNIKYNKNFNRNTSKNNMFSAISNLEIKKISCSDSNPNKSTNLNFFKFKNKQLVNNNTLKKSDNKENNSIKHLLDRKMLNSYNPRRLVYAFEKIDRENRSNNLQDSFYEHEIEDIKSNKKKGVILIIFLKLESFL